MVISFSRKHFGVLAFAVACVAAAAVIVVSETGYRAAASNLIEIDSAQVKRSKLNQLLKLILDAETGQRGYLLSGDESYLIPYKAAVSEVNPLLDALRESLVNDRAALAKFSALSRATSRKLAELEVSVQMRQTLGEGADWKSVIATHLGKHYMDAVRTSGSELLTGAQEELTINIAEVQSGLEQSRGTVVALTAAALFAFALFLRRSTKLLKFAQQESNALSKDNTKLAAVLKERTARLAALAHHLQTVQEQERERLARELHDEMGSLLTAAKLDVARVRSRLPANSTEALERVKHLTSTLDAGIALKRRIIEDLRPSTLSKLGLTAALEVLCREHQERSGVRIVCEIEPTQLTEETALTIYRVVQESLTNIAKYARANEVEIALKNYHTYVELHVADDGVGFDVADRSDASYGIPGLRHRVEALSGTYQIQSLPGEGTRVSVVVPVKVPPYSQDLVAETNPPT